MCPVYFKSPNIDFGGGQNEGINKLVYNILNEFPEIRITHFVIPNVNPAIFGTKENNIRSGNFSIDNIKFFDWVKWLKDYWLKRGDEIAIHGYSHYNKKTFLKRHVEFAYTSQVETLERITNSIKLFEKTNIPVYGFRPPGWDISSNLNLVDIIEELGFIYLAGSSLDAGLNYNENRVSNIYPSNFEDKIINIPQNLEFSFSISELKNFAKIIINKNGIISLKGHYTNIGGIKNSISEQTLHKINDFLKNLTEEYGNILWFATMKEIALRWMTLSQIEIIKKENSIWIKNKTKKLVKDLELEIKTNNYVETRNLDFIKPLHDICLINTEF